MRIACIGGGPGGLYASLLLRKANPAHEIELFDRNPPNATYGWGVVFSDETLGFLEEADRETHEEITNGFVHWEAIDIRYRGQTVRSGGHAFSGIARKRLLAILQARCRTLGVALHFEREFRESDLRDYDLIIAADGVNSATRATYQEIFRPSFDTHATKFIWLGSHLPLDAFTFDFKQTEHGMFQVHSYPFEPGTSTVIVECTEDTWRNAGLDAADERESIAFCERIFADYLQGCRLLSNRSSWINFVTLKNETWRHENIVLLGDAAHTAHFSIGSGTKMAMEDAIALTQAVQQHPTDLRRALVEYEELREPVVERTQQAARDSSLWFEHAQRYAHFEPIQFAFSLLTRSKRITYDNLKLRDAAFSHRVDRWFTREAAHQTCRPGRGAMPPLLAPFQLQDLTIANRVVASPAPCDCCLDGMPTDRHLAELGGLTLQGAGIVLTEMVAVSSDGRITPGSAGLYCPEHVQAWRRVTDFVHTSGGAIALQLGHAGRRGATRSRSEGADIPLPDGGWPLLAASPLPYTFRSRIPKEMDRADMDRVRDEFVRAAQLAAEANFDLLELHAGHGYLLSGFISPLTNRRADEYGGELEQHLRFPLEVFDAMRAVWPESLPISICLSVHDWSRGGLAPEEALEICRMFHGHGTDLIHIVTGQTTAGAVPQYGRAWETPFSDLIRNETGIPTLVGGNLTTADEINTILAAGRGDLCIASPLLHDPRSLLAPPVRLSLPRP